MLSWKSQLKNLMYLIEIIFVITIIFKLQDYSNKIIFFTLISEFFLFSSFFFSFLIYAWFVNIKDSLKVNKTNVSLKKTVKKSFNTLLNQLPKYITFILLYTFLFFVIISTDFNSTHTWAPVYKNKIIQYLVYMVDFYSHNGFLFLFSVVFFLIGLYIFITLIFVSTVIMYMSLIKEITTTNQKFIKEIYNESFEELNIFEVLSFITPIDKVNHESVFLIVNNKKSNLLRTFKKGSNPPLSTAF